jgi:ABC-2 type transport system permease protein
MDIFYTRLKVLMRNKANIFWAFLFPIFLGIFFNLGFGGLSIDNVAETIKVNVTSESIASNDEFVTNLITTMEDIEIDEDNKLFDISKDVSEDTLQQQLLDGDIDYYVVIDAVTEKVTLHLSNNGINQTILKSFLDQYLQVSDLIIQVATTDPSKVASVIHDLNNSPEYLVNEVVNINSGGNSMIIYFYALIAMICMYSSLWGLVLIKDIQADQSALAMRVSVSPTNKFKLVLIYFLAALTIGFTGNLILVLFLKYILGVELGNLLLVILVVFVGTIGGIGFGAVLSAFVKGSFAKKEGIISMVSLLLSAMSGLMSVYVKYLITKNVPFLGYINPANLTTEALYSLYYYSDLSKFYFNLIILAILSVLMLLTTILKIRGAKYDSI